MKNYVVATRKEDARIETTKEVIDMQLLWKKVAGKAAREMEERVGRGSGKAVYY